MKRINKLIRGTVFEIIVLISVVTASYFVWDNLDLEEARNMAYAYSNYNANLNLQINNNIDSLVAYNENNNIDLSIYNSNKIEKKYTLYIRVNKLNTTVDLNYIKVYYNNNEYSINDLYVFDKGDYKYYKLVSDSIDSKDNERLKVSIYLSDDAPSTQINKEFNFNFYVEER